MCYLAEFRQFRKKNSINPYFNIKLKKYVCTKKIESVYYVSDLSRESQVMVLNERLKST